MHVDKTDIRLVLKANGDRKFGAEVVCFGPVYLVGKPSNKSLSIKASDTSLCPVPRERLMLSCKRGQMT